MDVEMDYRYLINELDPTKYSDLINTLNHKKITFKELSDWLMNKNMDSYDRFRIFNKTICSSDTNQTSLNQLCIMYNKLYNLQNNLNDFNEFLNTTEYFDKIIFLKFLIFFKQQKYLLSSIRCRKMEKIIFRLIEKLYNKLMTTQINEDVVNTLLQIDVDKIYAKVINHLNNQTNNITEYKKLFNLNPPESQNFTSSPTANFFIAFHGTFILINEANKPYKYLTIRPPEIETTAYRWGIRGDPTYAVQTMKYTWKQYFIDYPKKIDKQTIEDLLDVTLSKERGEFNFNESQTTTNNIIRIKHYTVDSCEFMLFTTDYKIPQQLIDNLIIKITQQNEVDDDEEIVNDDPANNYDENPNKKVKIGGALENIYLKNFLNQSFITADKIIELNILLLNNNIGFNIFYEPETKIEWNGLKFNVDLSTKITSTQTTAQNFHFPLELFSEPELYIQDFTLERDIFPLEDTNISVEIGGQIVNFTLQKGDSFVCNPYIIQYFIENYKSKITIRPGYILNNKNNAFFKGQTITCPFKGLSCYKVTLAALTNYEILDFCKNANITTCNLYDTSCQSFAFISKYATFSMEDDDTNKRSKASTSSTQEETMTLTNDYDHRINKLLFSVDDRSFHTISLNFDTPDVVVKTPNLDVKTPNLDVETPNVDVEKYKDVKIVLDKLPDIDQIQNLPLDQIQNLPDQIQNLPLDQKDILQNFPLDKIQKLSADNQIQELSCKDPTSTECRNKSSPCDNVFNKFHNLIHFIGPKRTYYPESAVLQQNAGKKYTKQSKKITKKITKKERIIKNYKTKRNKKYKTKRNKKYKTINKRT
jgi:hypothetical protein